MHANLLIMGKKKNLPILEHIEITGVAAEGKAIAKIAMQRLTASAADADSAEAEALNSDKGMVVFVSNCVPGDIVDLQVTKKKHSFMEARVLRIVQPSPVRCEPRCRHFARDKPYHRFQAYLRIPQQTGVHLRRPAVGNNPTPTLPPREGI